MDKGRVRLLAEQYAKAIADVRKALNEPGYGPSVLVDRLDRLNEQLKDEDEGIVEIPE